MQQASCTPPGVGQQRPAKAEHPLCAPQLGLASTTAAKIADIAECQRTAKWIAYQIAYQIGNSLPSHYNVG